MGAGGAAAAMGLRPAGLRAADEAPRRPNIILAMTDDQGWGDTSYNGHPTLKTPNLDAMAGAGLRLDRFYAAAPVCSPTRGSVLTGRHPTRYGCTWAGMPLPLREVTIAEAIKPAGYVTGHFGKWHLNGVRGPGKPIGLDDPLHPGRQGFDEWFSVSNYFDLDTTFGRHTGKSQATSGDGSDVIVGEALAFIRRCAEAKRPFLAVVWYGSPHSPHRALPADRAAFGDDYYGEIGAVDRSLGRLRGELRTLGIADETILWFCSDNGGARGPTSTGGLRGGKGSIWEGGIRVPGIIDYPRKIPKPRTTAVPCGTVDIYPTILDLLGVKVPDQPQPLDGVSLADLLDGKMPARPKPLAFWNRSRGGGHAAIIDNDLKLHLNAPAGRKRGKARGPAAGPLLFDLSKDPKETTDLAAERPDAAGRLREALEKWQASVVGDAGQPSRAAPKAIGKARGPK